MPHVYVRMYVWMYGWMDGCMVFGWMHRFWMDAWFLDGWVDRQAWVQACMDACRHVEMRVKIYARKYMCAHQGTQYSKESWQATSWFKFWKPRIQLQLLGHDLVKLKVWQWVKRHPKTSEVQRVTQVLLSYSPVQTCEVNKSHCWKSRLTVTIPSKLQPSWRTFRPRGPPEVAPGGAHVAWWKPHLPPSASPAWCSLPLAHDASPGIFIVGDVARRNWVSWEIGGGIWILGMKRFFRPYRYHGYYLN